MWIGDVEDVHCAMVLRLVIPADVEVVSLAYNGVAPNKQRLVV